ncbi:hypothetical protein CYMTET_52416 [Cymbomonas tetramitiformis]|uniref:DDE Tnp4 domain-containing protein n=1 Tax=Cymbomonas tetramitiformis TaxID=36881 RepID=A0AAE0BKR4_9CHLO|nr:hypothetical protein CYMTET_52416 [Cymbomonas tetramitiformis]
MSEQTNSDSESDVDLDVPDLDTSSDDSADEDMQTFYEQAIPMFAKDHGFDPEACTNEPVTISDFTDTQCWLNFRFKKGDLYRLKRAVAVPACMKTSQGHKFTGEEGLLVMLNRLAYPSRLSDLAGKFRRRPERLSELFRAMTDWFVERHDSFMLRESKLLEQLEEYFSDKDVVFLIYGDPAYPVSEYLITGYKGINLTADQKLLNKFMSSCREAVEWAFGKVLQYQAYLDFKKNLKILLSPVSTQYKAGVLVTNMHTCLYGCTSSRYFDCDPPTLEEYCAL